MQMNENDFESAAKYFCILFLILYVLVWHFHSFTFCILYAASLLPYQCDEINRVYMYKSHQLCLGSGFGRRKMFIT